MPFAARPDITTDVIVVGGGPAGSTVATMLARKGARVLLLEQETFPRHHVGESLLPASVPVLQELGVLPAVQEAGFLPKWGATMVWGKESTPWSWYFKETNLKFPHSYQVWRPQFDQLLLENSWASGVDVREGHQALDVLFEECRAKGVRYSKGGVTQGFARARFVVDATGQRALLGHKLRLRRWDTYFRNMAIYGYFTGAQRLAPPDETNIFVESYPHGWTWSIPLHTGWTSVGAVMDAVTGREGVRRGGPHEFLMEQIAQAPYTSRMLEGAGLASGPFVVRDWSYDCRRFVGDGYVLAGDAACFIDPLFSSGVHLALMSGVLAAAYVTTALKDDAMSEPAGRSYEELYHKEYSHFREMAKLFYSTNRTADSYFWEAKRSLAAGDGLSPRHSFIRAVAGHPPSGYERAVVERGEPPEELVRGIHLVESDRAERRERLNYIGAQSGALIGAVPVLAPGVRLERKPVVAEGEFVWSDVLTTEGYPEGTPCSRLVSRMVSLIDSHTTVAGLLDKMHEGIDGSRLARIEHNVLEALRILYVDGAIVELRET